MRAKRSPISTDEVPAMRVVRQIEDLIAAAALVPGQRLIERDLMNELGATRRAVREALRYLAGAGVVELLPNRGARIARADPELLGSILEVYAALLRAAMELFVSRPLSPEVRKTMDLAALAIQGARATAQPLAMLSIMGEYAKEIFNNCGNEYLRELFNRINSKLHFSEWAKRIELDELKNICVAYALIHKHLMERDADAAHAVHSRHLQNALVQIRRSSPS